MCVRACVRVCVRVGGRGSSLILPTVLGVAGTTAKMKHSWANTHTRTPPPLASCLLCNGKHIITPSPQIICKPDLTQKKDELLGARKRSSPLSMPRARNYLDLVRVQVVAQGHQLLLLHHELLLLGVRLHLALLLHHGLLLHHPLLLHQGQLRHHLLLLGHVVAPGLRCTQEDFGGMCSGRGRQGENLDVGNV